MSPTHDLNDNHIVMGFKCVKKVADGENDVQKNPIPAEKHQENDVCIILNMM